MPQQHRVTFQPHGRAVYVLSGTKLIEAAARAGLTIDSPCGGAGTCGKCRVHVTGGACPPTDAERAALGDEQLADGWRLACQSCACGDCAVEVPDSSLFAGKHQILAESATQAGDEVLPAVRKVHVELDEPTLADDVPDLLRLQNAVGNVRAGLGLLRRIGRLLRDSGFAGTAVLADHHLIDLEPGDTTGACYGAAFDVGTTTVVAALLDLTDGRELALASAVNSQVRFGDDVLSRIEHGSRPDGLEELRLAALETIDAVLSELCERTGVARTNIYELTFAGNTTMQHLLAGIDPSQLGQVPFVPAFGRSVIVPAVELGIDIHRRAAAVLFPVIGGFVGGDTVAGLVATRLADADGAQMMIDIGTNGEIVLARGGELWAASTAAGPAFEGARISCGMRATAGAIEKVVVGEDIEFSVIGNVEPVGLCGSALVDLTAGLLDAGLVTSVGRMLPPADLPEGVPPALRERVVMGENDQPAFVLARREGGQDVRVTQKDIRELQLATGAIRAGVGMLLGQAGLEPGDLDRVLIAGGFGSFIRRSKAQRIGLLPGGLGHEKVLYVGNASLAGAKWALASIKARRRAEQLARQAVHVELSQDPDFQMQFAEAMIFPEASQPR